MDYNKRNYFLDNLKVLLISLVVFGHVIEYYIDGSYILKGIYLFVYVFHMPLFVCVSGYLSKNVDKCKRTAVKNLLIPYIVFNMIWYLSVYFATGQYMFSLIYPGWTLWYLLSLFLWRISLKYLIKIKHIVSISILISLFIGCLPSGETFLSFFRTINFLPFFLIGYFLNENHINLRKKPSRIMSAIIITIYIGSAFYIAKNDLLDYKFLYNSQSYADSGLNVFQGSLFKFISYVSSMILSICVANIVPSKKKFYTHIGKSTMTIYVFHIYLVILIYIMIPSWNISLIKNSILITSPLIIIYILSRGIVGKIYNIMFNTINKILSLK